MSKVNDLVNEIKAGLSQISSSAKDEERVMRQMLNDREFEVTVWGKDGQVEGQYSPAQDARDMIASVISSTTKISQDEAKVLAADHEFKKSEAQSMIRVSKEFVNTYLQTGRKLPLGGRENSDVALSLKDVGQREITFPKKVGVDSNGEGIYEKGKATIAAHSSLKVHAACPEWVK